MKTHDIAALEAALGHQFRRAELLEQALTHSSQAREQESLQPNEPRTRVGDNEQLEFLGDAVLGFVTSETLFQRFPEFHEGQLSKIRAHLVSERHLIQVAQELDLGRFLRLGRGEEKSGGRHKTALLVDALEAVLAALYLDSGLEVAGKFIYEKILAPELDKIAAQPPGATFLTDYKSALQEAVHAAGRPQPSYILVKEEGPEHKKTFTVEARLHLPGPSGTPEFVGRAMGPTKKVAEQGAARQALEYLWSVQPETEEKSKRKTPS
ncbi:MAG TPA: ribonuclease III [Terriglobales bacterium]|nr:ribonuclease III [Terriglobales bacterium]